MQHPKNLSQPILETSVSNQVLTVAYQSKQAAELARIRLGLAPHRRQGSQLQIPLASNHSKS